MRRIVGFNSDEFYNDAVRAAERRRIEMKRRLALRDAEYERNFPNSKPKKMKRIRRDYRMASVNDLLASYR